MGLEHTNAYPSVLDRQVLIDGSFTSLLFVHEQLELRGTERVQLKFLEHDYMNIFKVSILQEMDRYWDENPNVLVF